MIDKLSHGFKFKVTACIKNFIFKYESVPNKTHLNEVNKLKSGKISEPRLPAAHSLPLGCEPACAPEAGPAPPGVSEMEASPGPSPRIRRCPRSLTANSKRNRGEELQGLRRRCSLKKTAVLGFVAESPPKKASVCVRPKRDEGPEMGTSKAGAGGGGAHLNCFPSGTFCLAEGASFQSVFCSTDSRLLESSSTGM